MFKGLSRTQSFTLGFIGLVIGTVAIGWLGKSMLEAEPTGDLEFWHAGYYRDDAMDRLFTIGFLPSASRSDVERYAGQLTHTPGHTTMAVFYPEGSNIPVIRVSDAAGLVGAKQALRAAPGASPWRYAVVKDEAGELRLVDCMATPNDALCQH